METALLSIGKSQNKLTYPILQIEKDYFVNNNPYDSSSILLNLASLCSEDTKFCSYKFFLMTLA
jgi:hypothetical protein